MDIITIVQALQTLWVIFIAAMLFWRFRIGVAAYLAYILLVPYMKIDIGGFTLQWNLINILLLIAFFLHRQQHSEYEEYTGCDWRPLLPFAVYFGVSLLLIPFQDGLPSSYALNYWRTESMKYLILPFVLWNDILVSYESLKLYRNVTVGCIVIAVLYGLFLTTMPGINPYMIVLSAANGEEFNLAYAAGNSGLSNDTTLSDERIFGRISSVFNHPMTFGLFLGLSLFYLYRNKENIYNLILLGLTIFIMTDIIVCGVRSVIAASFLSILFLLIQTRNAKLFFIIGLGGCVLWTLFTHIPSLNTYLGSILSQHESTIGGSSFELRLSQLEGCFHEIQETFLEGKGYGWSAYYVSQHGGHPTILFFESLVFVILCNSGIIGMILWIVMSTMIIKYNQWSERPIAALLNALFIFYIAYACITGEYGYMQYFIIFYILMLGEELYIENEEDLTIENEEIDEIETKTF
jgi:hypothetical protein